MFILQLPCATEAVRSAETEKNGSRRFFREAKNSMASIGPLQFSEQDPGILKTIPDHIYEGGQHHDEAIVDRG